MLYLFDDLPCVCSLCLSRSLIILCRLFLSFLLAFNSLSLLLRKFCYLPKKHWMKSGLRLLLLLLFSPLPSDVDFDLSGPLLLLLLLPVN